MFIPSHTKSAKTMTNQELLNKKEELLFEIQEIEKNTLKYPGGWIEDETLRYESCIDYLEEIIREIHIRTLTSTWLWDEEQVRTPERYKDYTRGW